MASWSRFELEPETTTLALRLGVSCMARSTAFSPDPTEVRGDPAGGQRVLVRPCSRFLELFSGQPSKQNGDFIGFRVCTSRPGASNPHTPAALLILLQARPISCRQCRGSNLCPIAIGCLRPCVSCSRCTSRRSLNTPNSACV